VLGRGTTVRVLRSVLTCCAIIITQTVIIMAQTIRTLGDRGSDFLTELSRQGKRLFTVEDAAQVYGKSDGGLRRLLYTLAKRRWLQRVERGKYLILPFEAGREGEWTEHEFIIASYLIDPYYIGFRSALNYYGYTEQFSRTVFVASTHRKMKPALDISGVTYRFVHMTEKKFFGDTKVTLDGYGIRISEREKTIVDCLDRLECCGGVSEVAKALSYGHDELDLAKTAHYAVRNGNKAVIKRLGYIIELLNFEAGSAMDILRSNLSSGYSPLDTLGPRGGRYLQRWRLVINVPQSEVSQWREI
jgi:predicted transcriptional regulator of viral defense system